MDQACRNERGGRSPAATPPPRSVTWVRYRGGNNVGKEARIGLLLGATCCLLAVMVDWVVEELSS